MDIFLGTWLSSLKWNLIHRILNLSILGESWSTVRVLRSGTRSLWSVSAEIDVPTMSSQDRSHARVSTKTFFFFDLCVSGFSGSHHSQYE